MLNTTDTAEHNAVPAISEKVIVQVTIEKLVNGGEGLGRLESGEVVFVAGSVPGDTLEILLLPTKPKRGVIQKIVTPSPDRLPDVSPTAECDWLHMTLESQRRWKREIVKETLSRVGKLSLPEELIAQTLAPEDDSTACHYRNKVVLSVKKVGETIHIGYNRPKTHDVIPLTTSVTMPPVFADITAWLKSQLESFDFAALAEAEVLRETAKMQAEAKSLSPRQRKLNKKARAPKAPVLGGLEQIQLRANAQGELLVTLIGDRINLDAFREITAELMTAFPAVVGVDALKTHKQFGLHGRGYLVHSVPCDGKETVFQVSSGSFFQVNTSILPLMMVRLASWLPPHTASLADLYAGVGTFAIALQARADQLIAVEASKAAVADSHVNFERNDSKNVVMKWGDAAKVLAEEDRDVDIAVLDPPRGGCDPKVLDWVMKHVKEQLVYISCDAATLARDLKTLTEAGWDIGTIQPVDIFPQTHHIEMMVSLKRGETPTIDAPEEDIPSNLIR